ncbi:MAG: hypothetical protein WDM80_18130 [Limisphaerales bacterium]
MLCVGCETDDNLSPQCKRTQITFDRIVWEWLLLVSAWTLLTLGNETKNLGAPEAAQRFYLDLNPAKNQPLVVVCGGLAHKNRCFLVIRFNSFGIRPLLE